MKTILAWLALTSFAVAQQPPDELKTEKLAEGLWMISGGGGNVAVSIGKDGVFLVDDKVPQVSAPLVAEVQKLDKRPVRFVVNTHWHWDHTGANEKLGGAGTVLIAHDNVRKRMSTEQVMKMMKKTVPPSPHLALPVVTFAESVALHLNDNDVEVVHQPPGHTDGDAFVYWKQLDVLHCGDDFINGGYPIIDGSSGGHLDGMIAAAEAALKIAGPKTRVIPGHGALADRAKLQAWHDFLAKLRDKVKPLVQSGKTLSELIAAKPTAEWDATYGKGFVKPEMLLEMLWNDYKR